MCPRRDQTRAHRIPWLRDGTSLYDALGADFTLLRLGNASGDVRPLENAARIRNVPLKVLAIPEREVLAAYENFPFALIRPISTLKAREPAA
jgi:hypothetical protein